MGNKYDLTLHEVSHFSAIFLSALLYLMGIHVSISSIPPNMEN